MGKMKQFLAAGILIVAFNFAGHCQQIDFKSQLSSTIVANQNRQKDQFLGLRWIPEMFVTTNANIDFNAALNGFQNYQGTSFSNFESDRQAKLYRLWLRYSRQQYEIRLGLQKINFGPALLLRPLMWFDRIDPRDPLQLTDGVWGALFRYYFLNNANVWLWALYGNDETKGWEFFPTEKKSPELGGRFQIPLFRGEVGGSAHFRKGKAEDNSLIFSSGQKSEFSETRFALDGKWDLGIGFWFEAAATHQNTQIFIYDYQTMTTIGADYTFALGSGLHVLGEEFRLNFSDNIFHTGEKSDISAVMADYPLGLVDQVSAYFYFDWKNSDFYRLFRWQRAYDNWSFNFMGFWNPEVNRLPGEMNSQEVFSGKGLMLIIVFNH